VDGVCENFSRRIWRCREIPWTGEIGKKGETVTAITANGDR
jgi:hypothetical protein